MRIDFDPEGPAADLTFGRLFPLARRLRAILGECRALDAHDFLPAAGGKATAVAVDRTNPQGYQAAEIRGRVQAALDALTALADAVDGPAAPTLDMTVLHDPETGADDEPFSGRLGDAFDALDKAALDFSG